MGLGGTIFAATYDALTAGAEGAGLRAHGRPSCPAPPAACSRSARGRGRTFALYGDGVEALTLTEPEAAMARRLERRMREHSRPAELVHAQAEALPFPDGGFDVAVATLVLCTVDDQARALGELRRVLARRRAALHRARALGGARLAGWQDRLNGVKQLVGHGCNCNRPTLDAIRTAGFTVTELKQDKLPKAPPIPRPLAIGAATPGGA